MSELVAPRPSFITQFFEPLSLVLTRGFLSFPFVLQPPWWTSWQWRRRRRKRHVTLLPAANFCLTWHLEQSGAASDAD